MTTRTPARPVPHRCVCGELCVPRDATQAYPIELGAPRDHQPTAVDWLLVAGVLVGLVVVVVGWLVLAGAM